MSFIKTVIKAILGTIAVVVTLIVLIAVAMPSEMEVASTVQSLHTETARDFESQYYMVKETGSAMDQCVRAGFVAEAYLQARDNDNFNKWQAIEEEDCAAAGLINF